MKNYQLPAALTGQPAKYILVGLVGFIIGLAATPTPPERVVTKEIVKEVPKVETVTRTVYKTPESCKTALDIDNEIFIVVGEALRTFDFEPAAAKLEAEHDRRTENYADCVAS